MLPLLEWLCLSELALKWHQNESDIPKLVVIANNYVRVVYIVAYLSLISRLSFSLSLMDTC